ncbi:MAG: hypothetical protein CM15mP120_00980 [Pseudomonadota bacterium]|nr:MAG: hypothetical protein CM15mP120_00980 [Pseudomonadota bacterium]
MIGPTILELGTEDNVNVTFPASLPAKLSGAKVIPSQVRALIWQGYKPKQFLRVTSSLSMVRKFGPVVRSTPIGCSP